MKYNLKQTVPSAISLAWPVMLSNITIPLLGMVDIAVVGHDYPAHVLGAVAIGTMAFDVLFFLFGFLRMSTTGLVAQTPKDISILYRSVFMAFSIALLLIVTQKHIFSAITLLMDVPKEVVASLHDYFFLRIYASPMTLGQFVLLGYFFGRQNTKVPLVLLIMTNFCAITLDLIFVYGLNLGVKGLALANILAQTLGFLIGIWLVYRLYQPKLISWAILFDIQAVTKLLHLNKDIFIRTLCLMATFAYFTMAGSHLGTVIVSANAILLSMHQFMACGLDGFAIASEVLVGHAIGQKNKTAFMQALKTCGYFSVAVAVLFSMVYWFFGDNIIEWMSSLPEVVMSAKHDLVWMIWLPMFSVAGFLFDGVFIGATWSKPMRNTMLFSTLGIYFPSVFLLKSYGNTGLWMAFSLFMLSRGLSLGLVLLKKSKAIYAC